MIKAKHLSKRFRKQTAVDDLSFEVQTGKVTGFLGPNGAGKSTTMRLMLGLDLGQGTTTFDDKKLRDYSKPSSVVGVLLEAKAFHPTRSARNHLRVLATQGNIPTSRVSEVLQIVGLSEVAKKKPGKFSLGMSQRLGIAAAILAQPKYLLLDEPANGLDPEGMVWLRTFIKDYAHQGNGVLVSSHLLSEMSQMADNVVVIGKGKMITSTTVKDLVSKSAGTGVFVRAVNLSDLEKALKTSGHNFQKRDDGIEVSLASTDEIGKLAHSRKIGLLELSRHEGSLEQAFLELTEGTQEFQAKAGGSKK